MPGSWNRLQAKSRPNEMRDYNTEHSYRVQQGSAELQHYGKLMKNFGFDVCYLA